MPGINGGCAYMSGISGDHTYTYRGSVVAEHVCWRSTLTRHIYIDDEPWSYIYVGDQRWPHMYIWD